MFPFPYPLESLPSNKQEVIDRFGRYVSIDTQSDPDSTIFPSTQKQWNLLSLLKEELVSLGLEEVVLSETGYLTATLPASRGKESFPVIALIAHVDTSPDCSGENVKMQITEAYDGKDIILNPDCRLSPNDFPELLDHIGHTLLTTDGTTLLGADDKAGVTEIMMVAQFFMQHPEVEHGRIRLLFTPDEEIGCGVDKLQMEDLKAEYGYTVDGGALGELEYENFNAASAVVTILGRNIHPGYAKDKMINALQLAVDFHQSLPENMRPERTEGYEGFFHLNHLSGSVEEAQLHYIIRDHDRTLFENKKELIRKASDAINQAYGQEICTLEVKDQYYNMREMVLPHPQLITKAQQAMEMAGVVPMVRPIRGGTDGARLSYMGLPTPNLFTGGMNFHGRYEYCSVDNMLRAIHTLIYLIFLWSLPE